MQPPTVASLPTDQPSAPAPTPLREALEHAARLATTAGVPLDEFMRAAWAAFVDSRPGMRQRLETEQLIDQLRTLRARGQVGQA